MLKKTKALICLIVLLYAVAIYGRGPEFECTAPHPTFCKQYDHLLCVTASCAMIMKYWAKVGVVNDKKCLTYQGEFKKRFNTPNGECRHVGTLITKLLIEMSQERVKPDEEDKAMIIKKEIEV